MVKPYLIRKRCGYWSALALIPGSKDKYTVLSMQHTPAQAMDAVERHARRRIAEAQTYYQHNALSRARAM